MGAIQSAFNQALGAAAIAVGPMASEQRGIIRAEKTAKATEQEVFNGEYTTIKENKQDPTKPIFGTVTGSPSEVADLEGLDVGSLLYQNQPKLVMERGLAAAEEAYKRNPSKENLVRLDSMRDEMAAFRSVRAVQGRQSQYRDQSDNIKKVKQMQETVKQARYKIKGKETTANGETNNN